MPPRKANFGQNLVAGSDHAVAIGDLNNDGFLDLFMNIWLIGSGPGQLQTNVVAVAYRFV